MLEIKRIKAQSDAVIKGLSDKGIQDAAGKVAQLIDLDEARRNTLIELEGLRSEMNTLSRSIGQLMKEGRKEEAETAKSRTGEIKQNIKNLEEQLEQKEQSSHDILVTLPNVSDSSVPVGRTPEDNVVVSQNEIKVSFDFVAKPHWELALEHKIIDWELGSKITGSGFPVYIGKGARLQRALIHFFLDRANEAGYTELQVPLMVNEDSGFATGQLPDKEGQMYYIGADNFYMIPTAEVPITNLYRDVILKADQLPVKNCGYTPCFRREAGSYGAHVRGLNRLHQFDKVEIVQLTHPDKSYEAQEEMTSYVEGLLSDLGLPFRRLLLCTGDSTFTSAKTYDLEVYSAAQERWLEVSSISNFETYQANRLKLRFKEEKKTQLAHTLNGSALALPRIVASLIENYQQADGSILIPKVLQSYTGFDKIG